MIYLDRESCGGSACSKNLQYRRGPVAKAVWLSSRNAIGILTRIVSVEKDLAQTIIYRNVNCPPAYYKTSHLQCVLLTTVGDLGNFSQGQPDHHYKVLLHEESSQLLYLNPVE